jgi:hypothetical protein
MRVCGTRARYVFDRCRCAACRAANRAYWHRRKEWVNGWQLAPLVDAAPTRRRLLSLRARGIGLRTVCEQTGVSRSTLTEIATGRRSQVTRSTAQAIIGCRPEPAQGALIPAEPTVRRIRDLRRRGLPAHRIAQMLHPQHTHLQVARTPSVLNRTANLVERLWRSQAGLRCDLCGLPLAGHGLFGCPPMLRRRGA